MELLATGLGETCTPLAARLSENSGEPTATRTIMALSRNDACHRLIGHYQMANLISQAHDCQPLAIHHLLSSEFTKRLARDSIEKPLNLLVEHKQE